MGPVRYLLFKLRFWVKVSTFPDWVYEAEQDYYEGFLDKYGQRPYDKEKEFVGNSLRYKVKYVTVSQGQIQPTYYVKIKSLKNR